MSIEHQLSHYFNIVTPSEALILTRQFNFILNDFIVLYCLFRGYSLSLFSSHFLMNLLRCFIHHFLGMKGPFLKSKVHGLWICCLPQKPFFLLLNPCTLEGRGCQKSDLHNWISGMLLLILKHMDHNLKDQKLVLPHALCCQKHLFIAMSACIQ